MPENRFNFFLLYSAILLIALNGLFAKVIPLDAISMTQLRSVIAAIGLIAFCLLQNIDMRLSSLKQTTGVYILGILFGIHWTTFFYSMQVSSIAIGMLSLFSHPVISVLLEPWFRNERPKLKDIVAALIVFTGLLIIVWPELNTSYGAVTQGVFWGVVSAFTYSVRNILQKYYFADIRSNTLMLHQVIMVSLMLVFFIDITAITSLNSTHWFMLIVLGLLCSATAHTLLTYCMKIFAVKTVAMIGCIQPLLAASIAWLVIDEVPQQSVFIGGALIIGVALYESIHGHKN